MAPTVSSSAKSAETAEIASVFDVPDPVFGGPSPADQFPVIRAPRRDGKLRTAAYVAVAVAALSLLVNAILATIMVMQSQQSLMVPPMASFSPSVSQASEVDRACVAVLSNGGKPQDCARMYLMDEFPGFP